MKKTDDTESYARAYIDAALEAQRRLGERVEISDEDYENAVKRATRAFERLPRVRQRPREQEAVGSN